MKLWQERIQQITRRDTSFHGKPTSTLKAFISAPKRLRVDTALRHSDTMKSRLLPMNSGKLEAVQTVHQKKIGFVRQKNCGPVPGTFSKEERRKKMKPSNKDQIKGKLHELKGKVKEKAGQITNDPNLESEGQAEKIAGKVQKKVGQIEKVFEK